MPPDTITPPPPSDPGTLGGGGGSWVSDHKPLVIGLGVAGLLGVYLLSKNKSSTSSSTPSVYELAPGTQLSGTGATSGYTGGGGGQLSQALAQLEQLIAGNTAAVNSLAGTGGGNNNAQPIAGINAASYPASVPYASLASQSGGYVPVGYFSGANGTGYQGAQVGGGAPVYAGIFGGLFQNFKSATLPAGTELYVPKSLSGDIEGTTAVGPGASGYSAFGDT